MRNKFRVSMIVVLIMVSAMCQVLIGCGKKAEKWAYTHDPGKEIISFYDNGKSVYKGSSYTFTRDGSYINLTDTRGNELKLRYTMENDNMLLYEKSTYTYYGEKKGDGITGVWKQANGWSYQFTEDGRFSEEDIFFGHYSIDEANSCIKLMYDDPLEDTYLYYTLEGNELTVDYPWPMVRM